MFIFSWIISLVFPNLIRSIRGRRSRDFRRPSILKQISPAELPWERASEADARFACWARWADGRAPAPFRKLSPAALELLRRALRPAPGERPSLQRLARMRWLEPKG